MQRMPALLVAAEEQRGAAVRAAMIHHADAARAVAKRDQLLAEQHQAERRAVARRAPRTSPQGSSSSASTRPSRCRGRRASAPFLPSPSSCLSPLVVRDQPEKPRPYFCMRNRAISGGCCRRREAARDACALCLRFRHGRAVPPARPKPLRRGEGPAIHVLFSKLAQKTWMPGPRPGMTKEINASLQANSSCSVRPPFLFQICSRRDRRCRAAPCPASTWSASPISTR